MDWMVTHKIPHARIMSYGYDAYTRKREQLSIMTIYDQAETLVTALASSVSRNVR